MEISYTPLSHVLVWKAELSNPLFLFATIERAILDIDAQQLEVIWLMMLQLGKGGNGKNPADFSECWIKQSLNGLNSKTPLSPFLVLIFIMSSSIFSDNVLFFFTPLIFELQGGRPILDPALTQQVAAERCFTSIEPRSSVGRTDEPNVNGENGTVFNAQLTR